MTALEVGRITYAIGKKHSPGRLHARVLLADRLGI
jgi:hypothetical protein